MKKLIKILLLLPLIIFQTMTLAQNSTSPVPDSCQFDFWIGEWDVYPTGAKNIVGHSLIQMVSSGCALLENWTSPASNGKSLNFVEIGRAHV